MTPLLSCLLLLLIPHVLAQHLGVIRVIPEKGGDYCFLFPSHWVQSLQDKSGKNKWLQPHQDLTYSALCCLPSSFGEEDCDGGGLSTRIASVRKGNCNFFENGRLQRINGTQVLLILGGDAPISLTGGSGLGHNWGHCEESITPVNLLNDMDIIYLFFKHLGRLLRYNMGLMFILAVGTVVTGGYWAGNIEKKRQQYMKCRCKNEEDFDDVTIDPDVLFICASVVMSSFMLLALYCFYDNLVDIMIGFFSLYASIGLYSCLSPSVNKLPFGEYKLNLPYFHNGPQVRTLFLAGFSVSITITWMIFRNEDQWAWVLQDFLGISICLYVLKTIRMPTLKNCSLFLAALLVYDVFFVFITPFLTKSGKSIMEVAALGPSDSVSREKIPFLLKVPILSSASTFNDSPFTILGLGDIVIPGFLVAYCHRFDVQVHSSRVYFVASTIAYSYGLLVTFVVSALMQTGQPALLYLVPFTLTTSLIVALLRKELTIFWTGSGFTEDLSCPSSGISCPDTPRDSNTKVCQQEREEKLINFTFNEEQLDNSIVVTEELTDFNIYVEQNSDSMLCKEEPINQHDGKHKGEILKAEKNESDSVIEEKAPQTYPENLDM
ncbi:signal peptide peptidase-like 2B [Mauremys reevesii]|uniref:signal peptide peptidase-like 2B n=1 Tax=Mauremys reevesii TaxID=260615 RepID=UPI00193F5C5E|nr:signal peptide peptidase-like 2B [Mauremys reevesii]